MPIVRHTVGPRRSSSTTSLLWPGRALALFVLLALVGGIVSDSVDGHFWERHGLVAGVTSSSIVVLLSVAILNETIERRRQQRWKVLAQYVSLQLILNARLIWTGVAELTGKMQPDARTASALDDGSRLVRDTASLTEAVGELLKDSERRAQLHEQFASWVASSDEVFGRWAPVMLNSNAYAEVIDRHVELASYVRWLDSLLEATSQGNEGGDRDRTSRSRHHPVFQFEGSVEDDRLPSRIVTITQLAEELDRATVRFALRIIPVQWWADRLGITQPVEADGSGGYSYVADEAVVSS